MSKLSVAAIAAVGFLVGSRAGRGPYDSAVAQFQRTRRNPRVRDAVSQAGTIAQEKAGEAVAAAKQAASRGEDVGPTGLLDDAAEAAETSTESGPAAAGEYDPAQGSPASTHPVGQAFPDEAVRYDDPERPRS